MRWLGERAGFGGGGVAAEQGPFACKRRGRGGRGGRYGLGALLVLAGGCLPFPGQAPTSLPAGDSLRSEFVVHGAQHPAGLAPAADGRVFYTEQDTGKVRVVGGGALLSDPLATVPVNHAGERGLLGIALHPRFDENHRVYVFYTRSDTGQVTDDPQAVVDHRVVYFEASGNVATGGEVFVASLPAGLGTGRVSGRIAFAADGKLLVGVGDLTVAAAAADPQLLAGKILRYNDDGTIPADNPVADSPVYARGLRDVRGLCVDPVDGTPTVIDRNANGREEVNRIRAGADYGWPAVVGRARTPAELTYAAEHSDYVDPIFDTGANEPGLVGGSFNPSGQYGPRVLQSYFIGEAARRRIIAAEFSDTRAAIAQSDVFANRMPGPITDVVFTPAGTLYVACEGAIVRVVPSR
jgi:glucose/arabinose dehydrogenase